MVFEILVAYMVLSKLLGKQYLLNKLVKYRYTYGNIHEIINLDINEGEGQNHEF